MEGYEMLQAELIDIRQHIAARARICSGGCSFFAPEYQQGRKVAGVGTCQKHDSQCSVQVGIMCLWAQPNMSTTTISSRATALHR